ncbi:unnamed protein product [Amoebophrya sp. A120]|nr:unnamed protein product [Amoebophrya sp. A120]|eukprot:GSA120T00013060001.1
MFSGSGTSSLLTELLDYVSAVNTTSSAGRAKSAAATTVGATGADIWSILCKNAKNCSRGANHNHGRTSTAFFSRHETKTHEGDSDTTFSVESSFKNKDTASCAGPTGGTAPLQFYCGGARRRQGKRNIAGWTAVRNPSSFLANVQTTGYFRAPIDEEHSTSSTASSTLALTPGNRALFASHHRNKRIKTVFALPHERENPNKDYINDLVDKLWQRRAMDRWTPAEGAAYVWNNLAKGPHLGPAFIHLQYQTADIYSTNIAKSSLPMVNIGETGFGRKGRFTCTDRPPFSRGGGGTVEQTQTAKAFLGGTNRMFQLPAVNFRDKKGPLSDGRIRVELKEFGMDGKSDRILWDAIFDSRVGLKHPEPGHWDFSTMVAIGGSQKTLILPCTPKWDPRPHWFDMKITSVARFKPKEIEHWKEGWENIGGRAAHIGFTVQRHPIMENPNTFMAGMAPQNPLAMIAMRENLVGNPKRDYWLSQSDRCDDPDNFLNVDECRADAGKDFSKQSDRSFMPRWPTEFERRLYKDADPDFFVKNPDQEAGTWFPMHDSHGYYWWTNMTHAPLDSMDDGRPPIAPPMEGGLNGMIPAAKGAKGYRWLINTPGYGAEGWTNPISGRRETFEKLKPWNGDFAQ